MHAGTKRPVQTVPVRIPQSRQESGHPSSAKCFSVSSGRHDTIPLPGFHPRAQMTEMGSGQVAKSDLKCKGEEVAGETDNLVSLG